jgi:hypothetical protein
MRILALDLGVTTGWASLYRWKSDGMATVVSSGILTYEQYTAQLPLLLSTWDFDHIVMENPLLIARGQLRSQLENVIAWTMSAIGETPRTEILASDWKGTKYAKMKLPRGLTTHERDAIRLGTWFSETRLQGS